MMNKKGFIKPIIAISFSAILVAAYAAVPAKGDSCSNPSYKVDSSHLSKTVGSATLSNCKFGESKITVTFNYSQNSGNHSAEIESILDISSKNPEVETYDFDKYEIAQINSALVSYIENQS